MPYPNTHIVPTVPCREEAERHFREWLGHVEAGRIGNNPPTPPAVAAIRDANAALFARLRRPR